MVRYTSARPRNDSDSDESSISDSEDDFRRPLKIHCEYGTASSRGSLIVQ
jgi:hypothetical protein